MLTQPERQLIELLDLVREKYEHLPEHRAEDLNEFRVGIHMLQNQILARAGIRLMPHITQLRKW